MISQEIILFFLILLVHGKKNLLVGVGYNYRKLLSLIFDKWKLTFTYSLTHLLTLLTYSLTYLTHLLPYSLTPLLTYLPYSITPLLPYSLTHFIHLLNYSLREAAKNTQKNSKITYRQTLT